MRSGAAMPAARVCAGRSRLPALRAPDRARAAFAVRRLADALHPEGIAGKAKESNWLLAPDGPIYLVMRLYWPTETPPSILPPGAGTWNPPGVKRVS